MTVDDRQISVCICTFKRPKLLLRVLTELETQRTDGLFSYSVVVADNDCEQSGKQVVMDFVARSSLPVTYCCEPVRNIALVRNKALENAMGELIAFIDDDEYPSPSWLYDFFMLCAAKGVDGVLGPVIPYFDQEPPEWVTRGSFFVRPTHESGYRITMADARTSNVMFWRRILDGAGTPFRPEFGNGGEDTDFFMRMMQRGRVFVWCNEAVVYEAIPPARCKRGYLLRRALLRGNNGFKLKSGRILRLVKSFVAVPAYCLALPALFIAGDHHFMKYLIKLCDHSGRLLALFHINPIKEYK